MKSTFQNIKKRIFPNHNGASSSSKSDNLRRQIVHPHFQDAPVLSDVTAVVEDNTLVEEDGDSGKENGVIRRNGKDRSKAYEVEEADAKSEVEIESPKEISDKKSTEKRGRQRNSKFGFFRRSVYAMRFSAIDDTRGSVEKEKHKLERPKSVGAINTTSSLSVLSLVRRSIRRSRQSEGNMPVITVETSPRDVTTMPDDDLPANIADDTDRSGADISSRKSSLQGADEPDAAKSMSFGSDVNKSSHALNNNDDLDLNMNDIVVNVSRLNNKAAYDKIALRPKRRPARNARGTQQQHVIRVEAQVNGFVDEDVSLREDEEAKEDSARDISPPRAKKARPPTFVLPTSTQQDEDRSRPASSEGASTTPNRFSMLGRSPVGPGPGMIVPSLEDVQNIKLRKRQTDGKTKEPEEAVKKTPEKTPPPPEKPKGAKKSNATKKSSKQEQKGSSESSSSIFSWKKSASPKSPRAAKKSTDSSKENEKPKSLFPSLKSSKKTTPEKESKVSGSSRFFSSSDKKDSSKKKGILSGKREKNHSENNSKSPDEAPMEVIEVGRKQADIPEVKVQDPVPVSPEIEKLDIFTEKTDETSLLDQINAAMSERKNETGGKRESSGSKYAEKLKLQAQNLAESRVAEQEKSPKSPTSPIGSKRRVIVEGNKITVSADVEKDKKAEVRQPAHADPKSPVTPTRKIAAGPSSPTSTEKLPASPFKKPERAPSDAASKRPKSLVKETPRSTSPSIVPSHGAKATPRPMSGSDEDKKAARPSSPPVAEKPKKLSFKRPEKLPSGEASNHPKSPATKSPAQTHSVPPPTASVENTTSPVKETKPRVFSFGKADRAATKRATSPETLPAVEVTTPVMKERHTEKSSKSPKEEIAPSSLPAVTQPLSPGESKSPVSSPSSTETKSVRFAAKDENKSSETKVTQNEPDVKLAKEPVKSEKPHSDQAKAAELNQKSSVEVPAGTAQGHSAFPKTRATKPEVGQKSRSFDNDVDDIEAKEDTEQQPEEKGLRNRSLSTRSATDDSPSGLYSRTNLKPVGGDNLPGRRSASVRISPISSPSRASRPKSFHIKSGRSNSEISTEKESKSEIEPEKTKPLSPLTKPSPTKEKPKTPEKPKSPTKSTSRPPSIKTLMQDAENNNVKDPEATEKKDTKKTTPVSDQPVARRRNSKQSEEKADDGAPAWVQMARRRSKRTTPQRTPSTEDSGKSDNRSRGTSVPSKPLSVSRDKSPAKSEDRPGKSDFRSKGTIVTPKPRSYSTDKPLAKTEDRPGKNDDRSKVTSVPSKLRSTSTDKPPAKTEDRQLKNENRPKVTSSIQSKPRSFSTEKPPAKTEDRPKTLPVTGGKPRSDSTTKTPKSETPAKTSPLTPSSKVQYNRTASIPAINTASPRKPNPPPPKEVTPSGQPSWLAIAMQKQKNWAKEETV